MERKERLFERAEGKRRKSIGKGERREARSRRSKIVFLEVVMNKDKEVWEYLSNFGVVGLTKTWIEEKDGEK